jgi:hypothetical protein
MASEVRSKRISGRLQRAQDATGGPGGVQEETVNQLSMIQTKNSPLVQQNSAAEEGAAESNQSAQHGLRAAIGAFSSKSYLHEDQVTPHSPPPPSPGLNAQGPAAPCECAPDGNAYAVAGFCTPDGMALPGPCTRALDPRPGNEGQTLFQEAARAVGSPPGRYIHTHFCPPSTLSLSLPSPFPYLFHTMELYLHHTLTLYFAKCRRCAHLPAHRRTEEDTPRAAKWTRW